MFEHQQHHPELSDDAASRRLWAAVIRRCLDDFQSALTSDNAPSGDGCNRKLSGRARQLMFAESTWWLLGPSEGDVSLDRCCAVLGLDGDAIRKKVWESITEAHEIALRRRKLLPDQRAAILAGLAKGASSTQLGRQFGVNSGTVRKIRCAARREAAAAA